MVSDVLEKKNKPAKHRHEYQATCRNEGLETVDNGVFQRVADDAVVYQQVDKGKRGEEIVRRSFDCVVAHHDQRRVLHRKKEDQHHFAQV